MSLILPPDLSDIFVNKHPVSGQGESITVMHYRTATLLLAPGVELSHQIISDEQSVRILSRWVLRYNGGRQK